MVDLLKNRKVRLLLSLGAAFSFGNLFFGGLRDWVSPIGVLLIVLAAMPLLGYGFYLNLTAILEQHEAREKA